MAFVRPRKRALETSTPASEEDSGFFGSYAKSPKSSENHLSILTYHETNLRKNLDTNFSFKKPTMDPLEGVKKRLFVETPESKLCSPTKDCFDLKKLANLKISKMTFPKEIVTESLALQYERDMDYPFCSPIKLSPNKFWNRQIRDMSSPYKRPFVTEKVVRPKRRFYTLNVPRPRFDIVKGLASMDCSPPISNILSRLTSADLQNVSCVSQTWRKVVLASKRHNDQRVRFLLKKKEGSFGNFKENKHKESEILPKRDAVLVEITNEVPFPSNLLEHLTPLNKHDSFMQAKIGLSSKEVLFKCPRCQYPAKSRDGKTSECTRKLCCYVFCVKCLGPFSILHSCTLSSEERVPSVIGSKKSRKNLKRL